MERNELVDYLLIWLKLKFTHFTAKIEQETVGNNRDDQGEAERNVVDIWVGNVVGETDELQEATRWLVEGDGLISITGKDHDGTSKNGCDGKDFDADFDKVQVEISIWIRSG